MCAVVQMTTSMPRILSILSYSISGKISCSRKVVVNVGCGEAKENVKILDNVVRDLAQITGP